MYGKITEVKTNNVAYGYPSQVAYTYDAAGNRIGKRRGNYNFGNTDANYNWQVLDASGNVMATYAGWGDSTTALSDYNLYWTGGNIYGSSRIGMTDQFRQVDGIG